MANTSDQYVQIAPDSSGKKVRNLEMTITKPDGSSHTVEAQVVVLCDEAGGIADPANPDLLARVDRLERLLTLMLHELRKLTRTDTKQSLLVDDRSYNTLAEGE